MAFYLGLRFDISKEFKDFPLANWLNNDAWFDIKLLADAYGDNFVSPLRNDTYSRSIRHVLLELGLPISKIKHLGRGLGPKILETLENEQDGIRQLGNWNPSIQDVSYSTKLPMGPIRHAAGFIKANGLYHNPRCVLNVEDTRLLEATPFGHFQTALTYVRQSVANSSDDGGNMSPKWTALQFLDFMVRLNHVFLQDAAAIMVLHPDRAVHPIFRLPCFHMEAFEVSDDGGVC